MRKTLSLLLALSAATIGGEISASSRASAQEVDAKTVTTSTRAFVATEGNGTPGQVGLGIFIPFAKKDSSLFYFDAQASGDYPASYSDAYQSNTGSWGTNLGFGGDDFDFLFDEKNSVSEQVDDLVENFGAEGKKFQVDEGYSFSPRLGAKFLSKNKKWLFDVNAGYDLRYVEASTDWGTLNSLSTVVCGFVDLVDIVPCSYDSEDDGGKLFEQASFELSATNGKVTLTGYGNIALTDADSLTDAELILVDLESPLFYTNQSIGLAPASTYGLDLDYAFNSKFEVSAGAYYITADREYSTGTKGLPNLSFYDNSVDSMGVKLGVGFSPTPAVSIAVNASHDDIYDTKVSASVGYKFGASNAWRTPLSPAESIQQALSKVPSNRNIRLVNASALELAADLEAIFGDQMMIGDAPSIGDLPFIIGDAISNGPSVRQPRSEVNQIENQK